MIEQSYRESGSQVSLCMEHWRVSKKKSTSPILNKNNQLKTQQFNPDWHYFKAIIELELNMKEREMHNAEWRLQRINCGSLFFNSLGIGNAYVRLLLCNTDESHQLPDSEVHPDTPHREPLNTVCEWCPQSVTHLLFPEIQVWGNLTHGWTKLRPTIP